MQYIISFFLSVALPLSSYFFMAFSGCFCHVRNIGIFKNNMNTFQQIHIL